MTCQPHQSLGEKVEKETGLLRARLLAGGKTRSRVRTIITVLCCVVAFCTTYALILPAITANATAYCGIEEHEHADTCYEKVLVCGLEEGDDASETEGDAAEDSTAQGHVHNESCYETRLVCGEEEHVHFLACYSNPEADLETAENWERTVPTSDELCGEWATDLLSVAKSQLGYSESTENYQVASDGVTTKGFTRYGAWYGDPYGDWCAMFASFCLHYAGVDEEKMPLDANCQSWVKKLQKTEQEAIKAGKDDPLPARYRAAVDDKDKAYEPAAGDLVFFSSGTSSDNPVASHVGIVEAFIPATDSNPASIKTIEGNSSNMVERNVYLLSDDHIMGYGILPEQVFYCGQKGHVHLGECMGDNGQMICELPEHKHTGACLQASSQSDEDADTIKDTGATAKAAATLSAATLTLDKVDVGPDNLPVDYYVCIDGAWACVGSTTTGWYGDYSVGDLWTNDNRDYVSVTQVEYILGPYGFSASDGSNMARQIAYQQKSIDTKIYSDTNQAEIGGQQVIPLARNGEYAGYNLYYLPANTESFAGITSADKLNKAANMFYSVTVVDNNNAIYQAEELAAMTQCIRDGGEAIVEVRNAGGIIWSCAGKSGLAVNVASTQSGGNTTFTITGINQPIEVVATKTNPEFTVQYYANIPRFATSGNNSLKVIDTSGKVLPTNGGSMATKEIYLEGIGQNTTQNAGVATELYRVATTTELTKMYSDGSFHYEQSPELSYFNKLKDNEDYTLKEIWVLKSGKKAASTSRDDWDIYSYQSDTAFTNEAGLAVGNTILIADGAVLRLVSDASAGSYHNDTTFYDYNISSGQNSDGRWRTGITGINSESNYGTSLNGQRTWQSGADIFAFGNQNCGTGMSGYLFDESTLNKYSSKNSGYGGATFEIANGLNSNGTIRYNEWIVAPNLFNDGEATGKQTYTGSSLTFNRTGDTYTLSSATLKNSNGQSNSISGLQYFFNPSPTSSTTHTHIFTNNFWPMDQAAGRTDALWGQYGNPGSFQGFTETNNYNWGNLAANFPASDDGKAHNWFFGMNFALSFNLTADYEGPLEYYFFGDDDLWVFLDGQLVCDIGGVHSSIGEYVNLRDYLPVGESGQHTLSFFYTERGASGSTCYMSFTLPSVSSATVSQETGGLQIEKEVVAPDGGDFSNEEYQFKVELLSTENGFPLKQTYSFARTDGTYGTIKSGGTVTLKPDETVTISGIPAGTYYRVTELTTDGYKVSANGSEGYIVSGTIEMGATKPASFVNEAHYEMPNTGGMGTTIFYIIGGLLVMGAVIILVVRRRSSGK